MVTVYDVAKHILEKQGALSAMKLQKLCYYTQAWSLAWGEGPVFEQDFEAWANGPVCPSLYSAHRGQYVVDATMIGVGDSTRLSEENKQTIEKVIEFYGDKSAQWLSDLTHMERPWRDARKGIPDGERSNVIISKGEMMDYYGSL